MLSMRQPGAFSSNHGVICSRVRIQLAVSPTITLQVVSPGATGAQCFMLMNLGQAAVSTGS